MTQHSQQFYIPCDCHMHTPFCGHAQGEPEAYVQAAAARGVHCITFTCHCPMANPGFGGPRIRMDFNKINDYLIAIDKARTLGDHLGVEVLRGIEAEWFPEEAELAEMDHVLARTSFDYVIGSVHPHLDIYQAWFTTNGIISDHDKIACYWQHALEAVRCGRYDSLAHADIVRCYGAVQHYETQPHEAAIRALFREISRCDLCLEINTSGLAKSKVGAIHPDPTLLDWAAEAAVKITIGSDAHHPSHVALGFSSTAAMLHKAGWKQVQIYRQRIPKPQPLTSLPGLPESSLA